MNQPPKAPEPPTEYLEANDLQYLKADDLYFSALRNRFGLFEPKVSVFRVDERISQLKPVLNLIFERRGSDRNGREGDAGSPTALDVGCGEGNLLLTLVMQYHVGRCEGLDLSATKLRTATTNLKLAKEPRADTETDKELAREIKGFMASCPKNLLFEQDLRLFQRFFEAVNELKGSRQTNGGPPPGEPRVDLSGVTINFKMQSIFSYEGREKFQVVFLLRMTKWVFLTMGEESLTMLLEKTLRRLAENGVLIIGKVEKKGFKQTARVVHKKDNSTMHFGRHQAAIGAFIERNGLMELGLVGEEEGLRKQFWVLTRKENSFWDDAYEEQKRVGKGDY